MSPHTTCVAALQENFRSKEESSYNLSAAMNVIRRGSNEAAPLDNSNQSLTSILSSPTRPRRVKRYDSSPTVLTKAMISKAFPKRLPRKESTVGNFAAKAAFSESFTSISVENGLSSPIKRPIARLSPRRTRSANAAATPRKRKNCLPKSQLVIAAVSIPPLQVSVAGLKRETSDNALQQYVLPEKDTAIDKESIQAYDEHKKHFAKCRPSRRRVQFSEKLDDGPRPSTVRVDSISLTDLSLSPVVSSTQQSAIVEDDAADDTTSSSSSSSSGESSSSSQVELLQNELRKACNKIDQLLEVLASEDEESRRLAEENKRLRRRLRRQQKQHRLLLLPNR